MSTIIVTLPGDEWLRVPDIPQFTDRMAAPPSEWGGTLYRTVRQRSDDHSVLEAALVAVDQLFPWLTTGDVHELHAVVESPDGDPDRSPAVIVLEQIFEHLEQWYASDASAAVGV